MAVMDSLQTKQVAALAALSTAERERLARLAAMENTTAELLWPEVWLYGFDDVEAGIRAGIEADAYFKDHAGIANAEVMLKAGALIAAHGKAKCQAD